MNHKNSEISTHIEREFLRILEGGCTAPIGALAEIIQNEILFKGCLFSLDGKTKIEIEKRVLTTSFEGFGKECAEYILKNGGSELMKTIKAQTKL